MQNKHTKSHSILIVETDEMLGVEIKQAIEAAGFKTRLVLDYSDTINILLEHKYSLVVIDLPDTNLDVIKIMRSIINNYKDVPVVTLVCSKYPANNLYRIGVAGYLVKPFLIKNLVSVVDSTITISDKNKRIENRRIQRQEFLEKSVVEFKKLKKKVASLEQSDENSIVKSIEFDEDTCQAGISILSYFSTIVAQKYPETKVKVRIEQEGLKVRLVIETPTGEKENIEKTLEEYGLVVIGQMQPEELLPNPLQVMQLKHKLDMAVMEITHTKELLYSERAYYGELKEEVAHLRIQISEAFKREDHSRDILTKIIDKYSLDDSAKEAILKLSNYIECGVGDKDIILELLSVIKKQDASAFNEVKSYMIASLGGATGNLLSSWLPMVVSVIQKM